ncbi:MAG: SRPBCC domain-containing protein [Sphingobacterium composti]|uniref:SRPBCC domain-containing protein n=1 Tax=Sphingobacterium composti TaxID=363260 RepID=UPI00135C2BA4|nr:SRPBCC domain-containing protein [Sphingobacterium composti Ten et al. 2007 non Yoo et al. 2007]
MAKQVIHIETEINAPIKKVWEDYNSPESIKKWNQASPDWHCPSSMNDLRVGGRFKNRMEAKDGSFGFDFAGEYLEVLPFQNIIYRMDDERKVWMEFCEKNDKTTIRIDFEAEEMNPINMQEAGWQAILNSFKNYTESTI